MLLNLDNVMQAFNKDKTSLVLVFLGGILYCTYTYYGFAEGNPKIQTFMMGLLFFVCFVTLYVERKAHILYTEAKEKDVILFHVNCPTGLLFPEDITSCNYMTDGFKNIHLKYVGPDVVNTECGINLHSFIVDGVYEGDFESNDLLVGDVVHLAKFKNRKDGAVGLLNINDSPIPIKDIPLYGSFKIGDVLV